MGVEHDRHHPHPCMPMKPTTRNSTRQTERVIPEVRTMRRRVFLKVAAAAGTSAALHPIRRSNGAGIADRYAGLATEQYLRDLRVVAKVNEAKVFTEGPCCDRSGNVFFTNTSVSKILKWNGNQLSTFREDQNAANGLLFDRQGRLVACEGSAGRVTRTD